MKKIFLFAGMAALLASCANQETVEVAQSNAIGFNTYVGKTTRADVTSTNLQTFYVYGGYDANSLVFDGTIVSKTTGVWTPSETKFWVSGKTYNFAAVAPSAVTASYNLAALTINDYTPGDDDLVVAVASPVQATNSGNDPVSLNFQHALAKVQVSFLSEEDDNIQFTVSEVSLGSVINKGSLEATFNAGTSLEWTNGAEKDSYSFNLNDNKGVKYLLPQELDEDVVLSFKVSATGIEDQAIEKDFQIPVKTDEVDEWEMGHAYNYTINLYSAYELEEIGFEVVDAPEWQDSDLESNVGFGEDKEDEADEPEKPEGLADDVKLDFGNASKNDSDDSWNKITSRETSSLTLKYASGDDSPLALTLSGFSDRYPGNDTEPDASITVYGIEWPKNVWKDSFMVNDTEKGSIKISGLEPTKPINVTILATRYRATHTARKTNFELIYELNTSTEIYQGIAGTSDTFIWDSYNFEDQGYKFENVLPQSDGTIELTLIGTTGLTATDGCISAMVISPVVED
ncbi:MAG: fimbrillin family protein [Muribaculaceae bacterium]|nr:fimbrillin family protein [Muribaculaceae bacterium]